VDHLTGVLFEVDLVNPDSFLLAMELEIDETVPSNRGSEL
jgi:hypothetical protein